MQNTSYVGLSRLTALTRQMDVVANNIANASTPGYKAEKLMFVEYLAKEGFSDKISFVQDLGTYRDFAQGPMIKTDVNTDLAVQGQGYFLVDTPAGIRYTRLGKFHIGTENQLVTAQGYEVLNERKEPIVLPQGFTDLTVLENGDILADNASVTNIGMSYFKNEQALRKVADGYFKYDGPPLPDPSVDPERSRIIQGAVENSNVNGVEEMTNMIMIQRSFEMANRLMEAENERLQQAIRTLASVT